MEENKISSAEWIQKAGKVIEELEKVRKQIEDIENSLNYWA